MPGTLNFTPTPIIRPVSTYRTSLNNRLFFVKASANASEIPNLTSNIGAGQL
ncbi:hypothetical protein OROHE_006555 [Orobanche hederae]